MSPSADHSGNAGVFVRFLSITCALGAGFRQGNDIRLKHTFPYRPEPGRPVSLNVSFLEQYWNNADARRGGPVDREHLMMALADLEYILIKAAPDDSAQESA